MSQQSPSEGPDDRTKEVAAPRVSAEIRPEAAALPTQRNRREDLEQHYTVEYRREVAEKLLQNTGCKESILVDDVLFAVNETQQGEIVGLAGYTRCLLPAAEMSAAGPAHVVTFAPLLLDEIDNALAAAREFAGTDENLKVWFEDPVGGELVDLAALSKSEAGRAAIRGYIEYASDNPPAFDPSMYREAVDRLFDNSLITDRALLLPFQTRAVHASMYGDLADAGKLALLDSAEEFVDKVDAAQRLIHHDPSLKSNLTEPLRVSIYRTEVDAEQIRQQLQMELASSTSDGELHLAYRNPATQAENVISIIIDRERAETDFEGLANEFVQFAEFVACATEIYNAVQRKAEEGQEAYIKLDSAGVSGISNLNPDAYPIAYWSDEVHAVPYIASVLAKSFDADTPLPLGAVEDRVERAFDVFGVREYIVSGTTVDGEFHPWAVVRAINDSSDVFQGVIGCTDVTRLGISLEENAELLTVTKQAAAAQAMAGYDTGYFAKDLMFDAATEEMRINDHNDRRGGRSHMERIVALNPGKVFMDRDFGFEIPEGMNSGEYASKVSDALRKAGMSCYATATSFFPGEKEGKQILKMKIVTEVPDAILATPDQIVGSMDEYVRVKVHEHMQ